MREGLKEQLLSGEYAPQVSGPGEDIFITPEGQEFLRREFSRIYCYFVYKHVTPDGTIFIGYGKGKPNDRWQSGHNYKTNQDFSAAIHRFGWENIRHEILADHLYLEEVQAMGTPPDSSGSEL